MKFSRFAIIFVLSTLTFNFIGCKKTQEEPPSMPSEKTLIMDFSFFNSQNPLPTTDTSYKLAWNIVKYWDLFCSTNNKAIHNNAYKKALGTSPSAIYTKRWSWMFDFVTGTSEYLGELVSIQYSGDTAKNSKDTVAWTMSVAQIGTNDAYMFMIGNSAFDNSGGWWELKNVTQSKLFLRSEWKYQNGVLTYLKFINIFPSDPNNGGYIEYTPSDNPEYDKSFSVLFYDFPLNAALNNVPIKIYWNTNKRSGQILVNEVPFGSGWDF